MCTAKVRRGESWTSAVRWRAGESRESGGGGQRQRQLAETMPPPPPNPPNPPEAHTLQHANPGPQLSVGDRSHLHRACGRMGRLSKGDLTEGAELQLVQRGLRGLARRLGLEGAKAQLVGRDLQPHVMRAPVLIELRELLPGQHHMQQAHGPRLVARGAQVEPQLP